MAELTYTVKEAAEALGVCINTMYQLVNRADFPAKRIGARKWVISKAGLADWIEKQPEVRGSVFAHVGEV